MTDATLKLTVQPCPACKQNRENSIAPTDYDCGKGYIPELYWMDGSGTEHADELVKRWNLHDQLVAALEAALNELKTRIDWSVPNDERTIEVIKSGEIVLDAAR